VCQIYLQFGLPSLVGTCMPAQLLAARLPPARDCHPRVLFESAMAGKTSTTASKMPWRFIEKVPNPQCPGRQLMRCSYPRCGWTRDFHGGNATKHDSAHVAIDASPGCECLRVSPASFLNRSPNGFPMPNRFQFIFETLMSICIYICIYIIYTHIYMYTYRSWSALQGSLAVAGDFLRALWQASRSQRTGWVRV
jgi:hypothetical protein